MPSFEGLLLALLLVLLAAGALGLWATLRQPSGSPALQALGQGRFAEALETARTDARAGRDDLYAAAVAAKHLLELDRARALLDRLLAGDPRDGEAWLERGLVAAYAGDFAAADAAFAKVEPLRSDLLESLTLHRAWLALRRGDAARPAASSARSRRRWRTSSVPIWGAASRCSPSGSSRPPRSGGPSGRRSRPDGRAGRGGPRPRRAGWPR